LNRLLTDARFSADAAALIENVGRLEGHDLTEGELRLVAWINTCNFESVAGHLDSSLCRAGTPPKMPSHAVVGER
jgi:hypothetical protein